MIPYIGEIGIFGFNFAPVGWASCDGRLLAISDNQELFAVVGTTFGGDGKTNFAVPDLRGMVEPFKPLTFCIATEDGAYPLPDQNNVQVLSYLGEIRMFGLNFAPGGWTSCDGRLLAIAEHAALFSLLGTTFGGDGIRDFSLPDLRGMIAPFQSLTFCIATDGAFPTRDIPDPGSGVDPWIGEVRMFGFNFAPNGWASCDGRLLPIIPQSRQIDYQALFSLVGTTFGGNGKTNFSVPDLRGAASPLKPLTFCIAAENLLGDLPQRPSNA
jgi:microcystin-dependent protein